MERDCSTEDETSDNEESTPQGNGTALPVDSQFRLVDVTVVLGRGRGRGCREMTDREVGFRAPLGAEQKRLPMRHLSSTMMGNYHHFEDASERGIQRAEEARESEEAVTRSYEDYLRWRDASGPTGPVLASSSAMQQSADAIWSSIGATQQSTGAAWRSSGTAPSAAQASVENIRPILNELTAAVGSVQATPGNEVASVVSVFQNMTNLTDSMAGSESCRAAI